MIETELMFRLPRKDDWDKTYMNMTFEIAKMSYAKRRKVACLLIRDKSIVDYGYNGMPAGYSNVCENSDNKTKIEVLHAETNAIAKIAKSVKSSDGCTAYVTLSPCLDCAKMLHQSGIVRVVYSEQYRKTEGIDYLRTNNIAVEQLKLSNERN